MLAPSRFIKLLLPGLVLIVALPVSAHEGHVLDRATLGSVGAAEVTVLREALKQDPGNRTVALDLARAHLRRARNLGGEPHYDFAVAVVRPWLATEADADALVVRATARQARHDFDAAYADLTAALELNPGLADARLARAFVGMTTGRLDDAAADCTALAASRKLVATTLCSARLMSLSGSADRAIEALDGVVMSEPGLHAWVHMLKAEIALRLGDAAQALRNAEAALSAQPDSGMATTLMADALLASDRPADALTLLNDAMHVDVSDGLLLRRGLAKRELGLSTDSETAELARRFHQPDDHLHLREQARAALELRGEADLAVDLAVRNWAGQKEPDDALVLLQSALAAGREDVAADARQWYASTGLEDARADAANAARIAP